MKFDEFNENTLRAICDKIAATDNGLTGDEITKLLHQINIHDPSPTGTKRIRLFEALKSKQDKDNCGNGVIYFIQTAMDPVRYGKNPKLFEERRIDINETLIFSGLSLDESGQIIKQTPAQTLDQAQHKANRLRHELQRRNVHHDVLRFCHTEFIKENYFHAVLEATKSLADKIREKSCLRADGHALVDEAFGLSKDKIPILSFNSLQTESEENEHKGLMNLIKGLFSAFRNVTAHEAKIKWIISEHDALDLLTMASLLHRRLDIVVYTQRKTMFSIN